MDKLLGVLLLMTIAMAEDVDYHLTLNDEFDFKAISADQLKDSLLCLIDKGPCSELIQSFKIHYPVVVIEACRRCNDNQKHMISVYIDRVKKEFPDLYQAWRNLNDPEGKYFDQFEASTIGY